MAHLAATTASKVCFLAGTLKRIEQQQHLTQMQRQTLLLHLMRKMLRLMQSMH